jgi:hypothetical protein
VTRGRGTQRGGRAATRGYPLRAPRRTAGAFVVQKPCHARTTASAGVARCPQGILSAMLGHCRYNGATMTGQSCAGRAGRWSQAARSHGCSSTQAGGGRATSERSIMVLNTTMPQRSYVMPTAAPSCPVSVGDGWSAVAGHPRLDNFASHATARALIAPQRCNRHHEQRPRIQTGRRR